MSTGGHVTLSADVQPVENRQRSADQESADRVKDHDEYEDGDDSTSLFRDGMPGVMTLTEVKDQVDLDGMSVRVRGSQAYAADLVGWDKGSVEDTRSIKGIIAELVATLGPELAQKLVITF